MPQENERLDRLARILEESSDGDTSFAALDLDAYRDALGEDFAELEDLVETERVLEDFCEPPDSVRLPRDLGAWRLTREIGRGGMGVVYEAEHRNTGRRVAVKVLRLGYVGRAGARARFRREAEALARVRHPNIVDFLEAGEANEQPFYAMSLVDGRSLDDALRHGSLRTGERPDWRTLAAGLAEVADALHRLHEAGLVHRDLKPSNIVLDEDDRMVLADFGLATGDDFLTLTRTGDALGTPAYMAPEQVLGRHDAVDARSDVYGLGATLYHALSGRSPIEADDAHTMATAILRQRPKPPHTQTPEVPRALERIALKALEKKPSDRYVDAAALRDDLRAFAEGRPVTGHPVSAVRRSARAVRRHPLPVAAALAAVAVAALLLMRTSPASLHLEVVPTAEVLVDGRSRGQTPLRDLPLEAGTRTIVLRPLDARFQERVETLVAEEGVVYRLQRVLEPKDVGDWESVATLAAAMGVAFDRPTRPNTRRTVRTPDVLLVFPRGRVRPQDLAASGLRIDVGGDLAGEARIVFRRDGETVGEIPVWTPSAMTNRVELPPGLLDGLRSGDVVTWSLERAGEPTVETAFEIVESEVADVDLARLPPASPPTLLRSVLEARVLLNVGLPLAAWKVATDRSARGSENVLLLALEKEALEALLPSAKERAASRPWRSLLERLGNPERYSDAQREAVFGPAGE